VTPATDPLLSLISSLALAEGFHFYVLVCPARQEADRALERIASELPVLLGEPVELVRLDPQLQTAQPAEVPTEDLMSREALQPLLAPRTRPGAPRIIHVLDATLAHRCEDRARCDLLGHPREDHPWRWLFYQMNDLRNRIVAGLRESLILCLTPPMELLFAEAGADFWSIRGGDFLLPALPRPLPPPDPAAPGRLVEELLTLFWRAAPENSSRSRRAALVAARGDDWDGVRRWAAGIIATRGTETEYDFPEDIICAELLLSLLATFSSGWSDARTSTHLVADEIERLSAVHGLSPLPAELHVIVGDWAEQQGDLDLVWYEEGFRELRGLWEAGIGHGSFEPRLIRAALGCGRALSARGMPWETMGWLRTVEGLLARAPWRDLAGQEHPSSPLDHAAVSAAYASLGDGNRARFHASKAAEPSPRRRAG
jgi:hypothetical protein